MAHWFCIATRTGREFEATGDLSDLCPEVMCPTYQVIKRRRDRSRYKLDTPLFPGYVFAIVPGSAWDALHGVKAVYGVVSTPEGPTPICGRALALCRGIWQAADNGEFDEAGADERVKIGDVLRVLFGSWEGQNVTVVKKHPHEIECEADFSLMGKRPVIRIGYDEGQPV